MASAKRTYSLKGFIQIFAFSAAVIAGSLLLGLVSAPEAVDCERGDDGQTNCTLVRSFAGVIPLRTITINDLRSTSVETYEDFSEARRFRRIRHSHRLRLVSASAVDYTGGADRSDLESLRTELERLIASPSPGEVDVVLPADRLVHLGASAFLIFGLALVPLWTLGYFFPALRPKPGRRRVD